MAKFTKDGKYITKARKVMEQYEYLQQTGMVNMFDLPAVLKLATSAKLVEFSQFIGVSSERYNWVLANVGHPERLALVMGRKGL